MIRTDRIPLILYFFFLLLSFVVNFISIAHTPVARFIRSRVVVARTRGLAVSFLIHLFRYTNCGACGFAYYCVLLLFVVIRAWYVKEDDVCVMEWERARDITFASSRFFSLRIVSSQKRSLVSVQSVDVWVCMYVEKLIQNECEIFEYWLCRD